jgi:DNA-binding NarL/FixJ family response regulator
MIDCNREAVRVSVQHHFPVISGGISAALHAHPDVEVIHETEQRGAVVDVIVTDYDHGLQLASIRLAGKTSPRVMIVSGTEREADVRAALSAGINGYVLYDCTPEELGSAVVALGRGGRHFCAQAIERMADSFTYEALTPRELEVLSLMIRGLNNKLIARELGVSVGTVKAHANAMYGKLNASSRLQAVAVAVARGIGSVLPSPAVSPGVFDHAARRLSRIEDHSALIPA